MSATPSLRAHNGHLEPSSDLQQDFGVPEGATLYLVSCSEEEIVLGRQRPDRSVAGMSTEERMSGWTRMVGILNDGIDTAEERRQETAWELAHDRRKFGER